MLAQLKTIKHVLCTGTFVILAHSSLGQDNLALAINTQQDIETLPATDPAMDHIATRGAYAYGAYLAKLLENNEDFITRSVDVEYFIRGIEDRMAGDLKFSEEEISSFYDDFRTYMDIGEQAFLALQANKQAERQAQANAEISEAFLDQNSRKDGIMTTDSGLQYMVLSMGRLRNAPTPGLMNTVVVNYKGSLLDGTVFDDTAARNQPEVFQLTNVIMGFSEALQLMQVGDKYRFFVPPHLAYGSNPAQGIPANSVLVFDIELLAVI